MNSIPRTFQLLWDALFLQHSAYEDLRKDNNPFVEGLFIVVVVGVTVAVASAIGAALEWASSPNLAELQQVILSHLQRMPWWETARLANPQFDQQFMQAWTAIWQTVGSLSPSPLAAAAGIVTRPLGMVVGWLVFGVLAYVVARLLGGTGTLNQTLGTTALATAPQLLLVFTALPFVAVAGVGTWTLLCRYMALRTAHELTWPRAVWATILPPLVIALVVSLIAFFAALVFGAALAALIGGMQ